MMASHSTRSTWLVGLLDGALLGIPGLIFGIPGVIAVLLVIVVAGAVFRSAPLVSGLLIGAGGLWSALLVRQFVLICTEIDREPGACASGGLLAFAAGAAGIVMVGLLVGWVAKRR
jgi:hypothetical protein